MIQSRPLSFKSIITIVAIRERDFRGVDLNLLVTFLVLLRERSVSRAAARLHLGQPAISGALARLRLLLNDELLIRTARGMEPTARALALEKAIGPALEGIQAALFDSQVFDPSASDRIFTIGMPDWVELWLMPPLLAQLQIVAPNVRIAVKAADPFSNTSMLEQDEMDLGITPAADGPAWQRNQTLTTMGFVCVYAPQQVSLDGPLTRAQYLQYPHLLVSYRAVLHGMVDEALAQHGQQRQVRYATPNFATVPSILARSVALATVPEAVGAHWKRYLGLAATAAPLELPTITVAMSWHAVRDKDPALQWLRSMVAEVVKADSGEPV